MQRTKEPPPSGEWSDSAVRCRFDLSLDEHPKRCPVAPESLDADLSIRALTYGRKPHTYRVFFTVDDNADVVRALHVRRGTRQRPIGDELKGD